MLPGRQRAVLAATCEIDAKSPRFLAQPWAAVRRKQVGSKVLLLLWDERGWECLQVPISLRLQCIVHCVHPVGSSSPSANFIRKVPESPGNTEFPGLFLLLRFDSF